MVVWVLIAFWVIAGLAVVLTAMRGGARRRPAGTQAGGAARGGTASSRFTIVAGVLVLLVFGVALPAVVIATGGEDKVKQAPGGVELNASEANGREQFIAANCYQCHQLRASNAQGRVGPNLDELRPPKALVLDAIKMGRARGNGQMPRALLSGPDAEDVAAYVAKVAGR